MKLLTNEQHESYQNKKSAKFVKKIEDQHAENKNYRKLRDHCHHTDQYKGAAHSICNLKYSVPKEIPRFIRSSLSNLVDNFSDVIHKIKCKYRHDDKKYECFFKFINFKDDLIEYKCLCCNKNYQKDFDGNLQKRFFNTYKFFNCHINKIILLFQKDIYPYKYMDDWKKFNETLSHEKEDFYSHLNMEDITDADYTHADKVFNNFKIKNLGEYHDSYVQSDTLFLFEN